MFWLKSVIFRLVKISGLFWLNSVVFNTFFSSKYSKILVRRGKNRAKVAVAHAMLVSIYNMLSRDTSFVDLGGDYYQKRNEREEKRKLVAKIRKLGLSQEELAALLK